MRARMRTTVTICAAATLMRVAALAPATAQPADDAPTSYYLEATVNGRATGLVVQVDRVREGFRMPADELTQIGLREDALPLDADRQVMLDAIPDLSFEYIEDAQRIDFTLPESMLTPQRLGEAPPPPPPSRSGTGLLLNYTARLQSSRVDFEQKRLGRRLRAPLLGSARYGRLPVLGEEEFEAKYDRHNRTFALNTELRFFSPAGVFVNTGYATIENGEYDYVRQDTYWTYTNPDALRTWTVGDLVSSSLTWSRAIHMGGASLSRNFDVRPDLITFPLPVLGGDAVVPTMVDLYVNGLRQFTGNATGGPFVIASPPALTGAGVATVVFQDAQGRQVTLSRPLYLDTRLLGDGLTDYSVEVGYPRRNYGSRSFDYAGDPAANASLRHGISDRFTLEAHTELTRGLTNLGVGGLLELGGAGVLNASATGSGGDGQHGMQWGLGYQYQSPRFNIDLQALRADGGYRDLGSVKGVTVPQRQAHASLGIPIGQRHSITFTYTRQEASDLGGSRIVSMGYSGTFGQRLSVFASAFRDVDVADSAGLYIGASLSLERRVSVSSSFSRYGEARTATIAANRSMDYDAGGFAWNATLDGGNDGYRHGSGRLDYRGRYGEASLTLEHATRDDFTYDNASLYATGALVWMDGDLMATRTVYDAFALVDTNGLPDVPVLRENRIAGTTNDEGHLLIPDLLSWQGNRLAIRSEDLPPEVRVDADRLDIAPRALSGALASFPMGRYTGATVVLVDGTGRPLPVGTAVTVVATGEVQTVGYDGQVFLPDMAPVTRLRAQLDGGTCDVDIQFRSEDAMKTLGPFACERSP
ncbi:fimbria/pilus outer membrane usher protein [Lysobacter changpingensis]|uniref:fimbria/pilus outer membrane usher protein n=1 Tax=Lysobacter changpingensis TaxID=2792784 RepID=UPI001A8F0066|nr:fimbria/pilus outer membrane usher protein [Lysobacter changpingensis]